MKIAFILSQNIALLYCTISKILLICYTIRFFLDTGHKHIIINEDSSKLNIKVDSRDLQMSTISI